MRSLRPLPFAVLLFVLGNGFGWAQQTATVISNDPVSFVKGTSRITRPVRPDEIFSVTAVTGDEVTFIDQEGFQATLNRNLLKITDATPTPIATNFAPVVPVTNSVTATNLPAVTNAPPVLSTSSPVTPDHSAAAASPNLSPEDATMLKSLNDALQIPLFADTNLWDDDAVTVASRLQWPKESSTATDASYRRYALGKTEVSVLNARAYSMALYSRMGHPTSVSIVFVNKGDFAEAEPLAKKRSQNIIPTGDEIDKVVKDLNLAVKSDADTINAQLTALLGAPEIHQFGPTANSREEVHRWDWKGHAILFSSPRNEYAALKIVPSAVADHPDDVGNMDRETLKEELAKRVLKRDNGDVVLQGIPMVNQGPKGYCVPATWERYLRYVDVPADMYVLAMFGNTEIGAGTNVAVLREGVSDYVESYGRRVESTDVSLDVVHVSKFIDQGLPLMWGCFVLDDVEKKIDLHTTQRKTVTDWDGYKASLKEADKALVPLNRGDPDLIGRGHMRMIIGYNAQTDELAISDSWGERFAERWITVKEAQTISQNDLDYIQW